MNQHNFLSVETESQLTHYCQQLIAQPNITWIAIDTEFVREDTYFPQLSLVQIQDCLGNLAIIDPIKIQESTTQPDSIDALTPLIELLCDPNTLKVFHCARQDIEVLYQLTHKMPVAIFDTQIATLFLKLGEMAGFARAVKATLNISIDKSQTRTNWHARPLTEAQIQYALDDVRYLAPLYEYCLNALSPQELKAVEEECSTLLNESLYAIDPKQAGTKLKGIKALKPKQLAIAYALAEWREEFSIHHNQPKKWVLNDEVITHIAKRPPKTVEALYKVPNIKSASIMSHGETWIALIDHVFEQAPEQWPQPPKKVPPPTAQEEATIQLLNSYTQQVAVDYRLNLPSLLQRNDLLAILRGETPEKPIFSGWRNQLIGQAILAILNGQASLKLTHHHIELIQEKHA